METSIKVSGKKVWLMELALFVIPREVSMRATGWRTNNMVRAPSTGTITKLSMKETLNLVRRQAWELSLVRAAHIKVSLLTVCSMEQVNITLLIRARFTRENLRKINPVVWVR